MQVEHWVPRAFKCQSLYSMNFFAQDCQEFFKLLLNKLEDVFKRSSDENIAQVVPRLFRGTFSWCTTCKVQQGSFGTGCMQCAHKVLMAWWPICSVHARVS
ncbi:hypothetical protein DUNSADRAFT_4178 [Dunaliella salina]|uniref:Peptidase C19 ubiquitin carboxyl-terminal hydrolase domain-containing protein n=1 Tax=Dunaliella salina TaxID=3046 RepID=A0ABQ7FUX6_DUNSA|nr:hypothetical protein DUNSADRAFT_4178 [Dunaliella salina]|eukprot:KAF5826202.1 hypothetical protein DUNSADRAFT_4178 [Dunaliella salina]